MKPKAFIGRLDHEAIVSAIRQAESRSRGEIRVHVSNRKVEDAEWAAAVQFERLGMTATAERNGVLIYLAPASQRFAVIGDRGIHGTCEPDFWREVAGAMEQDFREGRFTEGIQKGIARAGDALASQFPRTSQPDADELPNEVTED